MELEQPGLISRAAPSPQLNISEDRGQGAFSGSYEYIIIPRSNLSPLSRTLFAAADLWSRPRRLRALVTGQRLQVPNGSALPVCVAAARAWVASPWHPIIAGFDRQRRASNRAAFQKSQTVFGQGDWHFWPVSRRPSGVEVGTTTAVTSFRADHPADGRTSAPRLWSGRKHLAATPPPFAVVSSVHRVRPQPSRRSADHVGTSAPVPRFMARRHDPESLRQVVATIRKFLRWEFARRALSCPLHLQLDTIRVYRDQHTPPVIPWPTLQQLLCQLDQTTAQGRRDFAILLLAGPPMPPAGPSGPPESLPLVRFPSPPLDQDSHKRTEATGEQGPSNTGVPDRLRVSGPALRSKNHIEYVPQHRSRLPLYPHGCQATPAEASGRGSPNRGHPPGCLREATSPSVAYSS